MSNALFELTALAGLDVRREVHDAVLELSRARVVPTATAQVLREARGPNLPPTAPTEHPHTLLCWPDEESESVRARTALLGSAELEHSPLWLVKESRHGDDRKAKI